MLLWLVVVVYSGGMVVHDGGAIRDLLVEAFPISFTDSLLSSLGRGFY